ncbi:hypothetical protein [Plantactinospora sp. B5E13]|uniref:hypothetical protein n=1 Tax=unclassified Plantactinospora TaxID=2631981 RepID=UPI00325F93DF
MRLPRSVAAWTIAVFGGLAVLLGAVGLIRPEVLLGLLGFEVLGSAERATGDYTRTFVTASSMASFNMGVYYLLAATMDWRPFFRFTVVFRLVTFTVFTVLVVTGTAPLRFLGVAVWEGLGAVATGVGLWLDRTRNGNQPVTATASGG